VKDAIGVEERKEKKSTIIKTQNEEKMFVDETYKRRWGRGTIFRFKDCHLSIGIQHLSGRSSKKDLSRFKKRKNMFVVQTRVGEGERFAGGLGIKW